MKTLASALTIGLLFSFAPEVHATASMNTCNSSNECRANVVTVYSVGDNGFVVLAGHIIPSICTGAAWGYYWSFNLTDSGDKARYATVLSAYLAGQPVELRTFDSSCHAVTVGLGE